MIVVDIWSPADGLHKGSLASAAFYMHLNLSASQIAAILVAGFVKYTYHASSQSAFAMYRRLFISFQRHHQAPYDIQTPYEG